MSEYGQNSYLFAGNVSYIESLYESWLDNPSSVSKHWQDYFLTLQKWPSSDGTFHADINHAQVLATYVNRDKHFSTRAATLLENTESIHQSIAVQQLILAYRFLGTFKARLDPLELHDLPNIDELNPAFYGLNQADINQMFDISNTGFGQEKATLKELIHYLEATYCKSIGAEFMYMSDQTQKDWLLKRLESVQSKPNFSDTQKRHILEKLVAAEGFEHYLNTRYVGQKRFSLEGGESLIPALDAIIQRAGQQGIKELVLGMAHRGRLNVLVNIMGKSPFELFAEFEGKALENELPAGDVKYHQGFVQDISTQGGPVHLSLAFNPSHLEVVNPVVEGSTKARMMHRKDLEGSQTMPILIHGDAAFAGQGVIQETLNMAQTPGYGTGGTLHIVINNQIGFTTSDPRDARSSLYCTDIVKVIEAPVLHVNGDDPEAVVWAASVALDFRMMFKKDVVLDIVCFRKLGHNEQDTPAMTQPLMYRKIETHPGVCHRYAEKLIEQGIIQKTDKETLISAYRMKMDEGEPIVHSASQVQMSSALQWQSILEGQSFSEFVDTSVPINELKQLIQRITDMPAWLKLHPLVERVIHNRIEMGNETIPVDWGMAEHLAYASLLSAGYAVRLTGEDSGRGTFVHRHAELHDQTPNIDDKRVYIPLKHISPDQSDFTIINSVLSELAVLAFEYGYATSSPNTLTLWEAQFGDFANGAQVVIDQFITSGEAKWGRLCGLVMLLPHGYEGQGPEHSSARLERYLQLCAGHNIQVVQPTTASQIFHVLRRQMLRKQRKPLIIMTPKSLLRNKEASSPLEEFAKGGFRAVLSETDASIQSKAVERVLLCTGRVYYDLRQKRNTQPIKNIAIIRLEELYPFPHDLLQAELQKYPSLKEIVWVQDEPENQGAWLQMIRPILACMKVGQVLSCSSRPASSSPAVGYFQKHLQQQKELIEAAFSPLQKDVIPR